MKQGHLDPISDLLDSSIKVVAEVEVTTLVSGPFSRSRVISAVKLSCSQTSEKVALAQEVATNLAMEGLRNGWEDLQKRLKDGQFPGSEE